MVPFRFALAVGVVTGWVAWGVGVTGSVTVALGVGVTGDVSVILGVGVT